MPLNASRASLRLGLLLGALFLTTSCAAFRGGELPEVSPWPPPGPDTGKSIALTVSGSATMNGQTAKVGHRVLDLWREQALRAYRDSGLFSEVIEGEGGADLRAEVHVFDRGQASLAMAFITGLTLYIIPSSATDELTATTTLRDAAGTTLATIEKRDSITLWQQILLIFVWPFRSHSRVGNQLLFDLNAATLLEARTTGAL